MKRSGRKKQEDIPKNIVVLVLIIAIIISVTGTWMVLDTISSTTSTRSLQVAFPIGISEGNIALNIEYDEPITQTTG